MKQNILSLLKNYYKPKSQEVFLNASVNSDSLETSAIRRILILSICLIAFPAMALKLNFFLSSQYFILALLGYLHLLSKLPEFWLLYKKKIKKEKRLSIYSWLFSFLSLFVLIFTGDSIFELNTGTGLVYTLHENLQHIEVLTRPDTGFTAIPWQTWASASGSSAIFALSIRIFLFLKYRPGGPRLDLSCFMSLYNSLKGQHFSRPWVPRLGDTPYVLEQSVPLGLHVSTGLLFMSELQIQHPTSKIFPDILGTPSVLVRRLVKSHTDWHVAVHNRHNCEDQLFMQNIFEKAGNASPIIFSFDAKNRFVPGHVIEAMLVHDYTPKVFQFFLPISTSFEEKTDMVLIGEYWLTKTQDYFQYSVLIATGSLVEEKTVVIGQCWLIKTANEFFYPQGKFLKDFPLLSSLDNYKTFTIGTKKFEIFSQGQADLIHKHAHELNLDSNKAMELVVFKESRDSILPDSSLILKLNAHERPVGFSERETMDNFLKYARKFRDDETFRLELRKALPSDQFQDTAKLLENILLFTGERVSFDWWFFWTNIAESVTIGIVLGLVNSLFK